jgi:hypothetical protein
MLQDCNMDFTQSPKAHRLPPIIWLKREDRVTPDHQGRLRNVPDTVLRKAVA